MENLKESINATYENFEKWGMLKELTDSEKIQVLESLKRIAADAIMESHRKITGILPDFYQEIRN